MAKTKRKILTKGIRNSLRIFGKLMKRMQCWVLNLDRTDKNLANFSNQSIRTLDLKIRNKLNLRSMKIVKMREKRKSAKIGET